MNKKKYTREDITKYSDVKNIVIKFIKKNGDKRIMRCTTNWKELEKTNDKYTPPESNTPNKNKDILVVWDVQTDGYKSIILNSIYDIIT